MTDRNPQPRLCFHHCEPAPTVGSKVTLRGFGKADGTYIVDGVVGHWNKRADVFLRKVNDGD